MYSKQNLTKSEIVLCTINARYSHASLALRYLYANLAELRPHCVIREYVDQQSPADIAESLLALSPRIVALSVYIWNSPFMLALARILKKVNPDLVLVIGGPEVSFVKASTGTSAEAPGQLIKLADHVVAGEGEVLFYQLCQDIFAALKPAKFLGPKPAVLDSLQLPYDDYSDEDIAHRTSYVESSRGCPYGCEFCLSSLDARVRYFALDAFLQAMDKLYQRGARHFKFVDRTFNLNAKRCVEILDFFYERYIPGLFLHFEVVPFHLHDDVIKALARFPSGAVQLELGIQSLDEEINLRIGRKQDTQQALASIARLRAETSAHLHVDLVAGLPGENMAGLAKNFDRLRQSGAHEIQLGILKKLAGAPIARHSEQWQMLYRDDSPYDLLSNRDIPFADMQELKRLAYLWDRIGNSGRFASTLELLLKDEASAFAACLAFSNWLFKKEGRVHAISLLNLARALASFLIEIKRQPERHVVQALDDDFTRQGKKAPRLTRLKQAQRQRSEPEAKLQGQQRQQRWMQE